MDIKININHGKRGKGAEEFFGQKEKIKTLFQCIAGVYWYGTVIVSGTGSATAAADKVCMTVCRDKL